MKILVLCVFVVVYRVSDTKAWGRGDLEKYGPFERALYSRFMKCDHDKETNLDVSLVNVYFYDFSKNVTEVFPIAKAASNILRIPTLDSRKRFIVFVPGYKSNINKTTAQLIRDTFRKFPPSYLIILDHSAYTNGNPGYLKGYVRSVQYVYYIGKALALMLAELNRRVSALSMHCIGHSLGGQMLGYTGHTFMALTGSKLWRITALDPAGPCFSNSLIEDQVRSGVAEYVEVYHCNAGGLGSSSVLGDIDFFLNRNGEAQPNCGTPLIPGIFDSSKAARCSHKACVTVYTATVNHPDLFIATQCDSYKAFRKNECAGNDITIAGFWNPGNATGVYYFNTEGYDVGE